MTMRHFLTAAFCLWGAQAGAQNLSGNQLHDACTMEDQPEVAGFCIGYITGAVEGVRLGFAYPFLISGESTAEEINHLSDTLLSYCPPPEAETRQMIEVVMKYLADNPATRHGPARGLILKALQDAFPCTAP